MEYYSNFITDFNSGDIPPCRAKNLPFTTEAKGIRSNESIITSYMSWSNLYLPEKLLGYMAMTIKDTFISEVKECCHLSAFMISTQEIHCLRIVYLT